MLAVPARLTYDFGDDELLGDGGPGRGLATTMTAVVVRRRC